MSNKNKFRRKGKKVYSIIVDGDTEKCYFQLMKEFEHLIIDIKPELKSKRNLDEQFTTVSENAKHFDKVIWIIDFDTIVKEDNERRKGTKPKRKKLKEYFNNLNKSKYKNVEILVNTPCLELWLLLHVKYTNKYFPNCDSLCKEFRGSILEDYEKSEKYYKKYGNDIYSKLKPFQSQAIINAKKLGDFDFDNPETAKAEIFKVVQELLTIKSAG